MKKLLIATGNPAKLNMFKSLLEDVDDIEFFTLSDFEKVDSPDENASSVEGNALIKAKYYGELFGLPTLADDAGLEIDDLGGEPGVKARRWGGELPDNVSDEDYLEFFLDKIKHVEKDTLHAYFPFSRCLYMPNGEHFFQNDKIDDVLLSKKPRKIIKKGWPLDSLMYLKDGRHMYDVPDDDPVIFERRKKEGLIDLISNL